MLLFSTLTVPHLILSFDWSLQSGLSATGIPSQPDQPRLCRRLQGTLQFGCISCIGCRSQCLAACNDSHNPFRLSDPPLYPTSRHPLPNTTRLGRHRHLTLTHQRLVTPSPSRASHTPTHHHSPPQLWRRTASTRYPGTMRPRAPVSRTCRASARTTTTASTRSAPAPPTSILAPRARALCAPRRR